MNFQEKSVIANLAVDVSLVLGYGGWLFLRLSDTAVEDIDYKWVIFTALVASVGVTILSQILLAVFDHRNANKEDVRDRAIRGKGNAFTLAFLVVPYFLGLGLAIFEAPYFSIVHVMFFGGALASIVTSLSRLWFYRRGF